MGEYNRRRRDRDIRPKGLTWEEEKKEKKAQKTLDDFEEEENI